MINAHKIWLWFSSLAFFQAAIFLLVAPARKFLMDQYLYENRPEYLLTVFLLAILGNLGLLFYNIKINNNKFKFIFSFLLILSIIFLVFSLYAGYGMRKGIGF